MMQITKAGSVKRVSGKDNIQRPDQPTGPRRPDSPPKQGDTKVSAKVVGPGEAATQREKNEYARDSAERAQPRQGQIAQKETHDSRWSKATATSHGRPPSGAGRQNPLLHAAKVEGVGQSAHVEVNPPAGGYAQLKKEVNGEIVKNDRILPGQPGVEDHIGTHPEEVKYTASSSRGGQVAVIADNLRNPSNQDQNRLPGAPGAPGAPGRIGNA